MYLTLFRLYMVLRHAMQGRTMQNKRAKYSYNSAICSVILKSNLFWKLFNEFFCTVTFKNVDFLSEFVVIETHVYVKASSATQATCASASQIK